MSAGTIYALSSAPGKAGVSVVRVSGPGAFQSLSALARPGIAASPRYAAYAVLRDQDGAPIDRALIVPFAAPASFTGEDIVEYHLHGSPAVVSALLGALSRFDRHREAEPGEFTRRAFENGKLDLTEAEAVADLIDAETEAQRRQALDQMGGALSNLYEGWRERLIKAMAYVEVVIDFSDEDVPDDQIHIVAPTLSQLIGEIEDHLNDGHRGERLRNGIQVAIVGAPNAGKSSLVNALARREVAIVSPMAGTTRDVVEVHLDLGGFPVILADTAGLRAIEEESGHGAVEAEGIRRARARAGDADLRLLVFDGTGSLDEDTLSLAKAGDLVIVTRKDMAGDAHLANISDQIMSRLGVAAVVTEISNVTGDGLTDLLERLAAAVKALYAAPRQTPSLTRARHRAALEQSAAHLREALTQTAPELMAEHIRLAAGALGRITGRIDVEDLLDVIFRDFCIGK